MMLLGNKKTQKNEQNWCLILNPINNEIDKRKVAHKISEAFSLSEEEAVDLVNNTPIILLENLNRAVAGQVKDYFRSLGAEILLTNDVFLKRKCYRTVWPEPPSLAFLYKQEVSAVAAGEPEVPHMLPADEALQEIRTLNGRETAQTLKEKATAETASGGMSDDLIRELDRLKKECENWREKFETQRRSFEKLQGEIYAQGEPALSNAAVHERDREIERLRAQLATQEESYDALRDEYQQVRALFEQKLLSATQEVQEWKTKADEMVGKIHELSQEKSGLENQLSEESRHEESWREKYLQLESELSTLRSKHEEIELNGQENRKRQAELERSKDSLRKMLEGEQLRYQELEKEHLRLKELYQQKISLSGKEVATWKSEVESMAEKVTTLEKSQMRLIEEIENRSQEAKQWEVKSLEFEKTFRELQASHESLEKMLQVNLANLDHREKELESARRQLKEMKQQAEQRDAMEKRGQLANQLVMKEGRLKDLISEQGRIEREIREREEVIRKILTEQELVEKDIIEGKQAQ
ncbi:MAG: hypothetical protein PHS88_10400, partial [Candidatus Omnitrophica bacterium]|nr:hypothetical protein [Candidatus Omnitrophota bacterium]